MQTDILSNINIYLKSIIQTSSVDYNNMSCLVLKRTFQHIFRTYLFKLVSFQLLNRPTKLHLAPEENFPSNRLVRIITAQFLVN